MQRILAIGDDPESLAGLGAGLTNEFELQLAISLPVGLSMGVQDRPDLILIDAATAATQVLESCLRIRAEPSLRSVPVAVIQSSADIEVEAAVLALAPAEVIARPVAIEVIVLRIRNLLQHEHRRSEAEHLRQLLHSQIAGRRRPTGTSRNSWPT
jgi:putative two-component system response regulator